MNHPPFVVARPDGFLGVEVELADQLTLDELDELIRQLRDKRAQLKAALAAHQSGLAVDAARDASANVAAVTEESLLRWVLALAARCNIRVHRFDDGSLGIIDVPVKYVAMIDSLHCAAIAIIRGQQLPKIIPLPPSSRRSKLRK
jgi:hypothetical protein